MPPKSYTVTEAHRTFCTRKNIFSPTAALNTVLGWNALLTDGRTRHTNSAGFPSLTDTCRLGLNNLNQK